MILRQLSPYLSLVALSALVACGTSDANDRDDSTLVDAGDVSDSELDNPDVDGDTGDDDVTETDTTEADTTEADTTDEDTTETDTSGEDTAVDTDTGTDTDIGVGDPDDEYIPPGLIPDACEDICQQLDEECDITAVQGEDCATYCEAALDEDQRHLASFLCATESCDPGCFDHAPEVTDACVDFCDEAIACDLIDEFDLPDDPGICAVACAGYERTTEGIQPEIIACMADEFADTCDIDRAEQCYALYPWEPCTQACEDLVDSCDDDTFAGALGEEGCVDQCMEHRSVEGLWAWMFCASMTTCDGFAHCEDVPVEEAEACEPLCDAAIATCPDDGDHDLTPEQLCGAYCTAVSELPGHDLEDAEDCITQELACYEDDDTPTYVTRFASCTLDPIPACEEACASLAACDPESEFLGSCLFICTSVAAPDEVVTAELELCLEEASAVCEEAACLRALEVE